MIVKNSSFVKTFQFSIVFLQLTFYRVHFALQSNLLLNSTHQTNNLFDYSIAHKDYLSQGLLLILIITDSITDLINYSNGHTDNAFVKSNNSLLTSVITL